MGRGNDRMQISGRLLGLSHGTVVLTDFQRARVLETGGHDDCMIAIRCGGRDAPTGYLGRVSTAVLSGEGGQHGGNHFSAGDVQA